MTADLSQFFPESEIESVKEYIGFFHDKMLFDEKLSDANLVLLVTYMLSNRDKKASVALSEIKNFFVVIANRKEDNFRKIIYYLTKKTKPQSLTKSGDKVSLTFSGLKQVKGILAKKRKE